MTTELQKVGEELGKLTGKLDKFIDQYECDMRGDKKLGNGEKGIVNEIREIKDYHREYPSLMWLLKHRTARTILTIGGLGLLLYFVGMVTFIAFGPTAVVEAFLNLLGVPLF